MTAAGRAGQLSLRDCTQIESSELILHSTKQCKDKRKSSLNASDVLSKEREKQRYRSHEGWPSGNRRKTEESHTNSQFASRDTTLQIDSIT